MPTRLRLLVVAEESAGIRLIKQLSLMEHDIVAVVAAEKRVGRAAEVRDVAESLGLPTMPPARLLEPDAAEWVRGLRCDLLLNVHSLHVLPSAVVEAPAIGSYNLHPGPLPEIAGLNAPSWTIFEERTRHGVAVHEMSSGIDTGGVVFQERFDVAERETGLSLMTRCVRVGVPLVLRLVDEVSTGPRPPSERQDLARRQYHGREVPNAGWIDWEWSARRIDAFVRACEYGPFVSPWGRPRFARDGEVMQVVSAVAEAAPSGEAPGSVVSVGPEGATVAAGTGVVLIQRLVRGESVLNAAETLRVGQCLRAPIAG